MYKQYIATGMIIGLGLGISAPSFYPQIVPPISTFLEQINLQLGNLLSLAALNSLSFITTYILLPAIGGVVGGLGGFCFYKMNEIL